MNGGAGLGVWLPVAMGACAALAALGWWYLHDPVPAAPDPLAVVGTWEADAERQRTLPASVQPPDQGWQGLRLEIGRTDLRMSEGARTQAGSAVIGGVAPLFYRIDWQPEGRAPVVVELDAVPGGLDLRRGLAVVALKRVR